MTRSFLCLASRAHCLKFRRRRFHENVCCDFVFCVSVDDKPVVFEQSIESILSSFRQCFTICQEVVKVSHSFHSWICIEYTLSTITSTIYHRVANSRFQKFFDHIKDLNEKTLNLFFYLKSLLLFLS